MQLRLHHHSAPLCATAQTQTGDGALHFSGFLHTQPVLLGFLLWYNTLGTFICLLGQTQTGKLSLIPLLSNPAMGPLSSREAQVNTEPPEGSTVSAVPQCCPPLSSHL